PDAAANNVREKVRGARRPMPPEVLPPVTRKQDPDADSIMTLVLASKQMTIRALTEVADKQVKRALESVDGVGAVTLSGGSAREIHVVVDIEKLNARGLSIQQVRDAIQKENVEIPGGTIEQGNWEVGLRTLGRIEATSQFDNIIIATVGGVPVRVADVAVTEDSVEKTANVLTIDDAIVVLENIFRYIEEKHCTPFEAAIQGTREVALPVMATTLSLIVIFLPVAFMTGYARRFIYPFGWTMAFAIAVSMLVSFTL